MICKNCGTENPDDVLTCYVCGEALKGPIQAPKTDTYSSTAYASGSYDDLSYGENKSRKGFYITVAAILAVVSILIFIIVNPFAKGAKTPKQAAISFASAFSDGNTKQLEKVLPPYYSTDKDAMNLISSAIKMLKKEGVKVSFNIKEYTKYNQSQLEDLREEIRYGYDYDADKIKEAGEIAAKVNMSFNYNGKFYSEDVDSNFVVVKIGGRWYVHDVGEVY